MRSVPTNTYNVLHNAAENGISVRDFVWVQTVTGLNEFGFFSDIDPVVSVPVISGQTGLPVTREYYGAGALRSVDVITLSVGLNVYTIGIQLSNLHPVVNDMVRGHDVRNARIEIHRGIIDPATGQLADPPMLHFMGTVNKADPRRGRTGAEGSIELTATSITNELTRTNPAKFSDATIRRRSGDRFCRYVDVMGDVRLYWGAKPK
ncbi:hypothetical protein EVB39_040 [Rhizobium phage RHph_TM3_3_9]|nr:hypothetical protein EVB39_040 [Rhizobium phage RHph_TM3_3_9]QIG67847.1 hypothetical protein EVB53_045 [Rhizobium phage RHph_Y60]QIG68561.1 hypothetical protein EVB66_040 [Rhizobium phage RHph_TM3_3_13]QIG74419.1 hypothetical protein EVC09_039 [Rhizobium phage RHph_TM3_3_10]QXV74533.1 hypothetical protein [Rhizobium phage RHEph19]